ncbi:MAG TPA: DsbA family protein [Bauldia sp.]|nr:DsbA family protein [Bauldia sp.]
MKPRMMLLIIAIAAVIAAGAIYFFLQPTLSPLPETATKATPADPNAPAVAGPASVDSNDLMVAGPLGDRTLGDPKAANVVIEYGSLTCSHCQAFNAEVFKPFKAKYIDTGKVYYIFREFTLNPVDQVAVMQVRCAPPEKFFALVDLLYEQQPNWAFVDKPQEALAALLKQAGISQEAFDACTKNQAILDGINQVKNRAAQKFGVNATPTFFFNGKKHEGEQTMEDIDKILAG